MGITDRFNLPGEEEQHINPTWFNKQKERRTKKDELLREWLSKEIDVLEKFHNGDMSVDEAAHAITRPISLSSIPPIGGYSDDCLALNDLWTAYIAAFVDWPTTYTLKLFTLLDAISNIPDKIHKGEALREDGEQLTWSRLPYFNMALHDSNGWQPGEIRQQTAPALLPSARLIYLRLQDIEAQCYAKGIVSWKNRIMETMIQALEKDTDSDDTQTVSNPATTYHQQILDFHIPAVAIWFKYNGVEIYKLAKQSQKDWSTVSNKARSFSHIDQRWLYWKERLNQLAKHSDDRISAAAKEALGYVENVEAELGSQV